MLSVYGQQRSVVSETNFQCDIVLDIYDAFYDWHTSTSWGGSGNPKSEAEKFSVGAVCVANKNDTNGSGTPDYQETNITQNPLGRNEIDLMKLVIRPRDPSLTLSGQVDLRLISGNNIKLWSSPVKFPGTQVSLPLSQSVNQLPITLYVEVLEPSASLRDIVFEAEFAGTTDRVSATAVWVELVEVYHQKEQQIDFEELGVGECHKTQITTTLAPDGSYFGYGPYEFIQHNQVYQRLGSRIFFHWQIIPAEAKELISIDGTRQRETKNWKILKIDDMTFLPDCKFSTDHMEFPFNKSEDNEKPNDDRFKRDPCHDFGLITDDGNFFTYDAPGLYVNEEFLGGPFPLFWGFANDKTNFLEWIRIAPNGYNFNPPFEGSGKLLGSRGSVKYKWAAARYTTKDKNFLHVKDEQDHSLNHVRVNQMGDDHNYYPFDYSISDISHNYKLATYVASIFHHDGKTHFGLSRVELDHNGECFNDVWNDDLEYPNNLDEYDIIFEDHVLKIKNLELTSDLQLNWNTFYSTNKKNELRVGEHFSNMNH